jgi:hypothetical protein
MSSAILSVYATQGNKDGLFSQLTYSEMGHFEHNSTTSTLKYNLRIKGD